MSFVPVLDRSQHGLFLVACEGCGKGLDWLTGVELTAMAIRGYRHFCFDCSQLEADSVPRCFDLHNDRKITDVEVWFPDGASVLVRVDEYTEGSGGRGSGGGDTLVLFSHNSKLEERNGRK